jgi:hypothetical protein
MQKEQMTDMSLLLFLTHSRVYSPTFDWYGILNGQFILQYGRSSAIRLLSPQNE